MSRSGWMAVEVAVAVTCLAALGLVAADVSRTRRIAAQAERRSADAEIAQNLLDRLRRGEDAAPPEGWSIARDQRPECIVMTVSGHGVRLMTVVPR
jgi:hypothetical protein